MMELSWSFGLVLATGQIIALESIHAVVELDPRVTTKPGLHRNKG
jgi:hypothetical protein